MTTHQTSLGKKPTHRIYSVTGDGQSSNWTEIGAAWPNSDGKGFVINYRAIPLNGRIIMRLIVEKNTDDVSDEPSLPLQRANRRLT